MSMFDDLLGKATGGAGAAPGGGLVTAVMELLVNRQGGISGLLEAFQQKGMGQLVSSWIGTGANLPVSGEQIQQVFGAEQIQAVADKSGVPPETAKSQMAELLPNIVDRLTPGGQVPQGGDLMSTGMNLLRGVMPGRGPET